MSLFTHGITSTVETALKWYIYCKSLKDKKDKVEQS